MQGFIQPLLIMSVLWKKNEFYKREIDCEVIIVAPGGLKGTMYPFPSRQIFPLWMGAGDGEPLLPHQSKNDQSFPSKLVSPSSESSSLTPNFLPSHESLSPPTIADPFRRGVLLHGHVPTHK